MDRRRASFHEGVNTVGPSAATCRSLKGEGDMSNYQEIPEVTEADVPGPAQDSPSRLSDVEVPVGLADGPRSPAWGSDIVAEMLRRLGIEYISLMPGATFRGFQDSLVNYNGNRHPQLLLCPDENSATALARGYARATGRPMAVALHDTVGLLLGSMAIFDAWCDRVPMLILGGGGPVDAARRRPLIDWIHHANTQAEFVRPFTKWDDQPASLEALPESLLRAYKLATTEPCGPVYVCLDRIIQETAVGSDIALPVVGRFRAPEAPSARPEQVRSAARALVDARFPIAITDRAGKDVEAVRVLVELAELLAMPVVDQSWYRRGFPTPHALDFAGAETRLLQAADVVIGVDAADLGGAIAGFDVDTVISVSLDELVHRGQTADYQVLPAVDLPILSSAAATLPALLEACRSMIDDGRRAAIEERRSSLAPLQAELRKAQAARVAANLEHPEITQERLVAELWQAVNGEDHAILMGNVRSFAPGVFTIADTGRDLSGEGGGAVGTQLPTALGSALALRGAVDVPIVLTGDGDFMMAAHSLWVAARYGIPALVVVMNNRSYLNDEHHQERIAVQRGRPVENAWIGMRLDDPVPDFAGQARAVGVEGIGPVKRPQDLAEAFAEGVRQVRAGACCVVDVWIRRRDRGDDFGARTTDEAEG